jgi:hypothetical protein
MKAIELRRFAGINDVLPPERISNYPTRDSSDIELIEARNVDIDNARRLSRRTGQTMTVAGNAVHSLWSNDDVCLYVANGVMFRLLPDFTSVTLAAGLSSAPLCYAEVNGRVYHSNGIDSAVYDDGRVRGWGIPIAGIRVGATATGGNLVAGVYQYAMTFIREDGFESGCALAGRIELPDNGAVTFDWDVPHDPAITDAALYLTQPDGETLLQAVVVDVELATYTYNGGPRGLPLATQWLDAPPAATAMALYRGRLYIASGEVLYATAALSFEHCDLRDFRSFDGSPITLLAPVVSGVFVGTASAIYFLAGATLAEQKLDVKLNVGAVRGSLAFGDGEAVTGRKELAGQGVVLFATAEGVVLGLPDGALLQLTRERYNMLSTGIGAALFEAGPYSRYLLSMQV